MGKMVMALKKLGKKLTGKTINNDNTVGVINEIADKYEGGGGGIPHLYQHFVVANVYISADDVDYNLIFNYYSTNNTPLNSMSQVIDVLNSRRCISGEIGLSTGLYIGVRYGGNQEYHNCLFESISEQNDYINLYNQGEQTSLYLRLNDHTSTEHTIEDTVVEI